MLQETDFGPLLKQWRKNKRYSQLELALEAEISQRHISFLESGRSNASVNMVHRLAKTLKLNFQNINQLLLSAGHAPQYSTKIDAAEHDYIWQAVDFMLESQMPYPTILLDDNWDIIKSNLASQKLLVWLMDLDSDEIAIMQDTQKNILELTLCNERLRPTIQNWAEVAGHMVNRALDDGIFNQMQIDKMISGLPKTDQSELTLRMNKPSHKTIIPIVYEKNGTTLSLISMQTRFMMAQNISLNSLSIESFIANDAATKAFFEQF